MDTSIESIAAEFGFNYPISPGMGDGLEKALQEIRRLRVLCIFQERKIESDAEILQIRAREDLKHSIA